MNNLDDYTRTATEEELLQAGIKKSRKISHCSQCQNPCGMIHDIELSDCHGAGIYFQEVKEK